MSVRQLAAYKIEVLVFGGKGRNGQHRNDMVVPDMRGTYVCPRCGWQGNWESQCPKCDYKTLSPKDRIKVADVLPVAPSRTLIKMSYSYERAKRWGARFGSVVSCHKIDTSPYLENIEHLNLKQEPITIELEKEDFVLNKALELERPRRRIVVERGDEK